jgi:hypothetical protein
VIASRTIPASSWERGSDDAIGNEAGSREKRGDGMTAGELELFSTAELIDELLRRTTFQGVVVHAQDGAKSRDWSGERIFSVRFNANLGTEEVGRLLDVVSQHLADKG